MATVSTFVVEGGGPMLAGTLRGDGDPVLLLHGGPGLSVDYLEPLADELANGYAVAAYQQRGQEPSAPDGPFEVADHVDDVRRVLDALDWERALVVGHSWGGHLALHVAEAIPDRVRAVLAVDPLGAVGDGGSAEFEQEMNDRTPAEVRERATELDERAMRGEGTEEDGLESLELVWPAYFADPASAPPMPPIRMSVECYADTMASIFRELPALELGLPGIDLPVGFVVGAGSPMPVTASTDTAQRIPDAWVDAVPEAGHFVWLDAPGRVRSALDRLSGTRRLEPPGNWFAAVATPQVALPNDFPDVDPVRADPARGPRGRRGAEPPAPRPGGLHPPGRTRHLHLAAARAAGAAPDRADHPRRDERHRRPGAVLPRAAAP